MLSGEMNGLQVLDAIKSSELTCDILVAMVTECGQHADRHEANRRGADGYFIKPFSPLELIDWLQIHVRGRTPPAEVEKSWTT